MRLLLLQVGSNHMLMRAEANHVWICSVLFLQVVVPSFLVIILSIVGVRVTKATGSISDECIYWLFIYKAF
jgi:hypothetical protein